MLLSSFLNHGDDNCVRGIYSCYFVLLLPCLTRNGSLGAPSYERWFETEVIEGCRNIDFFTASLNGGNRIQHNLN